MRGWDHVFARAAECATRIGGKIGTSGEIASSWSIRAGEAVLAKIFVHSIRVLPLGVKSARLAFGTRTLTFGASGSIP